MLLISYLPKSLAFGISLHFQLQRMLPSFCAWIKASRWFSLAKIQCSWCLICPNHGGSLHTFSFNGGCLKFPPKSRHPADFPLQKCNGLDVLSTVIIGMGDLFRLSSPTQRSRLFLQGNFSLMPWFSQEIKVTAVSGGRLKNLSKPIIFQFETSGVIFEGKKKPDVFVYAWNEGDSRIRGTSEESPHLPHFAHHDYIRVIKK